MPESMPVDEILDRAADLLDIHGWSRGLLRKDTGELCMVGAMQMVVYPESNGHLPVGISRFIEMDEGLLCARIFMEQTLEENIAFWNDNFCADRNVATETLRTEAKRYREKGEVIEL
jgi:hypothetical protein